MEMKKLLILAPVALLSLTSCGKRGVRHKTEEYFITPNHAKYDASDDNAGLSILQLSDLHIGTNCDREVQFKFIQKTIDLANAYVKENHKNKEKVDMIVITGDVFTFGTREIVKDFCNFMEKQQIDWTLTFGNHDEQAYFSVDWLTGYLNSFASRNGSYLMFKDYQDDDITGNANFVISVPKKDAAAGNDFERLYIFDSNRYRYQIGSYGYDYIHYDQIDWYERAARFQLDSNAIIDPSSIHSLAFFHIPFEEFETYNKAASNKENNKAIYVKDEKTQEELKRKGEKASCPKENTHLFGKMHELGSTKGVFVGHDHVNNSAIQAVDKSNIILSYGVKGTDTVYNDDDLIGGQVIHVKGNENKTISIHSVTHTYKELGD